MGAPAATVGDRAAPVAGAAPGPPRRRRWRRGLANYLFVAPAGLLLLAVMVFPILFNVQMSFRDVRAVNLLSGDAPWVGLAHYADLLSDPGFWETVRHSVLFTVGSIVFQVAIGLALALFYSQRFPGATAMRAYYLIAWTIPIVVSGAVWRWLLDGRFGVVNWVFRSVGLAQEPVNWLAEPDLALGAVIGVNIWLGIPFNLILLLAGLQAIPRELYEAASVDGASALQRFRHVTLPLLRPALLAVLILGLIYTFKVFDLIWIMTGGGPIGATEVLPTLAYKLVFQQFQFGSGAAVLNLQVLVLLVLAVAYLRAQRREEAMG